ncbi:formate dehydrogenase subunit alpha [Mycobacterium montefiorense]|uniref:Formate dehydrogenase subunit alpha n=2 Tax=Mycobacterium montefiorense TaxID=154654 RepID=A0AA37PNB1_9MYCO|nr:formate dehydrogenase subunit alpha [Mycobacterium montefiorense]GKU34833.1 formate dehydrogenase subunit alpha [Mycobacterium montefiorense]GKU40847.1 formate dehydrogenase subunit alpha [Mycobacterium montefiorense]GKU46954.1 formate dehydrogenase subunit alpha [Mycobacterium montefiorense]GKU49074.1 formate dehydrogenase subunit alpha [Mycobacterium montefiorense]
MANADCIVIQGSNMAECHPVGFQWVEEAKARGARLIHIDPRFTRTSAVADKHIPIRAGSDVVLLGALINHIISGDLWFKEYVVAYTNAATLISENFCDAEELGGLFSGFDPETGQYDPSSWAYQEVGTESDGGAGPASAHAAVLRDDTLQHPRTVFQILKRHYARYTPEMVKNLCGISLEDFDYLARSIVENSGRERTTCFAYAVGWTQHTLGAQFIRTATILQLLLGNVGRPGSGIMALRGHASIQGSTDIPTLFNLLPGYLPMPKAGTHDTLADYLDAVSSKQQKGFWANADTYTVSLLKAWWGDAARADNDFAYDYLPRLSGPHGTYQTVMGMLDDEVEGYFLLGQNPAVGSAHGRMQRLGMAHLKWLVVRDLNLIESATWWKDGPEIVSGELETEKIETEVFFFPAATHVEKAGSFTQTQRLLQWRHKAVEPPGDCQSECEFFYELGKRIRARLAGSTDERDRPLLDLTWDYRTDEHGEIDGEAVLAEYNGYHLTGPDAGKPVSSFTELRADGSTAAGCWIYSGVYANATNQSARRVPHGGASPSQSEWGWAWPADRRILYNRASADPDGNPWSERKRYIWWDAHQQRWIGHDVPDFVVDRAPNSHPDPALGGPAALAGDDAFIMQADGKGWLFAPTGVVDGPLPTHYEPQESPVANALYPQQQNPSRVIFPRKDNLSAPSAGDPGADVYPYVFTTYRLTEHHTAGGMSRWLPYLSELQPEMFCEVSPELAAERGLEPYGWATIISPRSAIEARVLVTERMTPLRIGDHTVHQIGLPYHWGVGSDAVVSGDAANDLLGVTLDPNVQIQESKAGSCDIQPGRRPQGAALLQLVAEYQSRAGATVETDNIRVTEAVWDIIDPPRGKHRRAADGAADRAD